MQAADFNKPVTVRDGNRLIKFWTDLFLLCNNIRGSMAFPATALPDIQESGFLNSFITTQNIGAPEGNSNIDPINKSGVRALVNVKQIGQTNTITGFATGMDPYKAYVSLFYDAGSPGSGPCACIPSNPLPAALANTWQASTARLK